jgi:hypothetical protein
MHGKIYDYDEKYIKNKSLPFIKVRVSAATINTPAVVPIAKSK